MTISPVSSHGVKAVDKQSKFLQDRLLDTLGQVSQLFEHIFGLLPQCQPGRTIDLTYEQLNEKSKTTVFSRLHHPIPQVSREPWVRCTARFPQFQMQQLSTQLQGSGEELARILLSTALQPSNIQLEQQGMYVSLFPFSRTCKALFPKLGIDKQRPMGYRDSSGISYQSFAGPISACPTLASCSQQRAECSNRLRGQSNARESSYPHSPPTRERARFYKCSFSSSKEGGWPTPGSKFTSSKPVHPLRTFQDGRDTHAPGPSKEGRLHGENRPKRCILYDTGLEKPSEIPSVYLEGNRCSQS
jgi:hypothetical protein